MRLCQQLSTHHVIDVALLPIKWTLPCDDSHMTTSYQWVTILWTQIDQSQFYQQSTPNLSTQRTIYKNKKN